jgi:DNA-directed RNA polymerase specialized sigma24 family protein
MHIRFPAARPETDHMHMRPSRAGGSRIATDPAALDAFYRQHIEAVTRFLARRTTDPFAVADMTAEVFVAAIRSAADFEPGLGSERAWLYGIAQRADADDRRARAGYGATVGAVPVRPAGTGSARAEVAGARRA